ncbi:MAG: hypothetical protein QHH02_07055 [Syntrophomonadaceae bacterium]|nr:hypothetical protein [Syntrophomonadaceae bacterium]
MAKILFVNFRIEQEGSTSQKNVLLYSHRDCREEALIHGAFRDYFGSDRTRTIQPCDLYYSDRGSSVYILDWQEVPPEEFEVLKKYLPPYFQEPVEFGVCGICGNWFNGEGCPACKELN